VQALDAVLGMNGIGMVNVGDKFVKAVPLASIAQAAAPASKTPPDQLPELGPYVTHVVQLKYAKPTEMVSVLQPFASAIPNPILPIDSSQMLVLRDFSENVKRMLEMVARIDVAIESDFVQEVIPIKYALASEIASALNSLSTGGGGTTVGGSSTTGPRPSIGTGSRPGYNRGGGTMGYPGGTTQPGMNPLNPSGAATTTGAPGAAGTSFSDRLNRIIQRASVTGDIQVLGQTKIIADERTNSLLIFASKEDMKMIKDIVSKLDIVLAQVLIEAVVLEVDITGDKDFGISYLQTTPTTAGGFTGIGAVGKPFFTPGDFAPIVQAATNAGAALKGGFNYLASFNDLDVTVTAIANDSRSRILQRPRIQTSHAVQATLFVGESRPYPTASYYGGGSFGSYSSIQQLQIGVTLDVTPLINPDGLVVMDIHQTIENYAGFTEITGVGQVPNTTRKEAAAKVAVRDHDTIILGGLIETTKSRSGSGVPWLMDIPVLGYLFRTTSLREKRTELIVLIRPTVLPTPEIAALTAKAEKDKMPGVSAVENEIRKEERRRIKQSETERDPR
jgi:general secretion pathway protein D